MHLDGSATQLLSSESLMTILGGESRLHACDIKRLHLEDGLILPHVRLDELTVTECLQGVVHSTCEFNVVCRADSGRPSY